MIIPKNTKALNEKSKKRKNKENRRMSIDMNELEQELGYNVYEIKKGGLP